MPIQSRRRFLTNAAFAGAAGLGGFGAWGKAFAAEPPRGEVVLVVGGAPPAAPPDDDDVEAAVRTALADDPSAGPRQVAERVAAALGIPKRRAYDAALRIREGVTGVP